MILVVKEREGDLLLDRFFLITSLTLAEMNWEDMGPERQAMPTAR